MAQMTMSNQKQCIDQSIDDGEVDEMSLGDDDFVERRVEGENGLVQHATVAQDEADSPVYHFE